MNNKLYIVWGFVITRSRGPRTCVIRCAGFDKDTVCSRYLSTMKEDRGMVDCSEIGGAVIQVNLDDPASADFEAIKEKLKKLPTEGFDFQCRGSLPSGSEYAPDSIEYMMIYEEYHE